MDNTAVLKSIFVEIFQEDAANINEASSQDTIEKWDSMGMVNLIMSIEQKFAVEFDILEIADFKTFGIIKSALEEKGIQF